MRARWKTAVAFSLTEMVIALGIISFALVAAIGLLGVGLSANRQSTDDTALAAMTSQVLGRVQAAASPSASSVFFFNAEGFPVTNGAGAFYRAAVAATAPRTAELADVSTNLMKVRVVFTWPVSAPVPPHTNTVHASLLLP